MGILGVADYSQYLCQKRGNIPVEMKMLDKTWKSGHKENLNGLH